MPTEQPIFDRRITTAPPQPVAPELPVALSRQAGALEVMEKGKRKQFFDNLREELQKFPEGQRRRSLQYLSTAEKAASLAKLYRAAGPNFTDEPHKIQDEELWAQACFLAAALPEEQNQQLWTTLQRMLIRGKNLDDRRLTPEGFSQKRRGAMAEYAVGLAIAALQSRHQEIERVEKTDSRQDVRFGRDLTVHFNGQPIALQVKVISDGHDEVEIWNRRDELEWKPIINVWLHYRDDISVYFDEATGQPTAELQDALSSITKTLGKVAAEGEGNRYVKVPAA